MKRRAWPLLALAALFFGPLLIAILLYANRGVLGGFGQLPNPDRELLAEPPSVPLIPLEAADGSLSSADWARYRWSLIYAKMSPCEGQCDEALKRLNQVVLALGEDRDRTQRVFLAPGGGASEPVPEVFLVGLLDRPGAKALIDVFGRTRLDEGRYFVVDPLGNLILSYPADADQQRLLEDLERLLDVSRVG